MGLLLTVGLSTLLGAAFGSYAGSKGALHTFWRSDATRSYALSFGVAAVLICAITWLFRGRVSIDIADLFLVVVFGVLIGRSYLLDIFLNPSMGGGTTAGNEGPEYTVYRNDGYHILQVYRGSDIYGPELCEIDMAELGGSEIYIRSSSRDILYTARRDSTYGCWYVVEGMSIYGEPVYTVYDDVVCKGRDPLRNSILWRIRPVSNEKTYIERY